MQPNEGWSEALKSWTQKALLREQADLMARARSEFEKTMLDCALDHTGGKRVEAARLLGLGRNTLSRKLKEFDLEKLPNSRSGHQGATRS